MSPPLKSGDLRGAARLAVEATLGVTDLVEALHARIAGLPSLSGSPAGPRTAGISRLVYGSVRGVTRLVGGGLDAALGLLAPALLRPASDADNAADATDATETRDPTDTRDALLAALNGVLGDHLLASNNPLCLDMQFRQAGQTVTADGARPPQAGALLLLHGLCMNDRQWLRKGSDLGAALGPALQLTPIYLRYNSGLAIHRNGAELALRLQALVDAWPGGLQRLVLLGHSMGGLLARSALHQARALGLDWPDRVSDLICLGSPHAGAPLERVGHLVDRVLEASPYAAPFARLGQLRSAGITDLRHGSVLVDDAPAPLPPPPGLRSFALAGRLQGQLKARALGDGLVPVASALGEHRDPSRVLHFGASAVIPGVGHLDLLSDPAVAEQLRAWLLAPA